MKITKKIGVTNKNPNFSMIFMIFKCQFLHSEWSNLYDFWNLSYFLVKESDFGIYFIVAILVKKSKIYFYKSFDLYLFILLIIAVFELVESAPCRSVINKISENIENIENI